MPRVLALIAGVILAAGLWAAAPALSLDPYVPRAVDFEQALDVPAPARAAAARTAAPGGLTTRATRAPRRFDLVGLRWSDAVSPLVWVRVRRDGGSWTRWVRADADPDHRPDRAPVRRGSDPVWAGGADHYQVRLSRPVRGLRAHFVNSTGTATPADRLRTTLRRAAHSAVVALASPVARAATTAPPIVARDFWGASQCPPRSAPAYGQVSFGVVHHTVSANSYRREESAGIVLAICRFHRNSNGWSDIGYNFLVDRYGQIFEGRAGGIENAVVGAQAAGVNSYSSGVANIGDFSTAGQSGAGHEAVARLLAWKLAHHGVPTQGTVVVNGRPFERISGHRDANSTSCPGNALYAQLPSIRARAAALGGGGGLSLVPAARRLRHPASTVLTGRLTGQDGAAIGGATLELQARTAAGAFVRVGSTSTLADGRWSATLASSRSGVYRAHWAGDNVNPPATSPAVPVAVAPLISIRARAARVAVRRSVVITGTVTPAKRRLTLLVFQRARFGWRIVGRRTIAPRGTRFVVAFPPAFLALYRFQAVFAGDPVNASIGSGYAFVRTYRLPARR